jgi:hypothetical protein
VSICDIPTPTADSVRLAFDAFESVANGFEGKQRKALLRYLLYSMRAAAGRYDELFDDTTVDEPRYRFFDSGLFLTGRQAIVDYHRSEAAAGAALTLPGHERIASAGWGFAAERVDQIYPATDPSGNNGQTAERFRTAVVWRADASGRMRELHFYPAVHRDICTIPEEQVLVHEAIANVLQSSMSRIRKAVLAD